MLPASSGRMGFQDKSAGSTGFWLPVIGLPKRFVACDQRQAYYTCRTTEDFIAAFRSLQAVDTRRRVANAGRAAYIAWRTEDDSILGEALKAQKRLKTFSSMKVKRTNPTTKPV